MTVKELLTVKAKEIAAEVGRHEMPLPEGGVTVLVICEEIHLCVTVHLSRNDEPTATIPDLLEEARQRIFGDSPLNGTCRPRARRRKGQLSIHLLPFKADLESVSTDGSSAVFAQAGRNSASGTTRESR